MTELAAEAVEGLRTGIEGTVSLPGDAGYADVCSIWNGAIDRHPAVVASCTSSTDVAAALRFAGEQGLEVSVRGGGHNYAGYALSQDGLMIDLTPMKYVTVDAAARRAVFLGAARWRRQLRCCHVLRVRPSPGRTPGAPRDVLLRTRAGS